MPSFAKAIYKKQSDILTAILLDNKSILYLLISLTHHSQLSLLNKSK